MGNASTRRITVANDNGVPSVIKVSDSVIHRLKESNEPAAKVPKAQQKPAEVPQPVESTATQTEALPVAPIEEAPPSPVIDPTPTPAPPIAEPIPPPSPPIKEHLPAFPQQVQQTSFFPEEAHLALLRLRQERELELKKVEDYWREKLKNVESKYVNLNKLTSEEFAKSVSEVEQLYKKEIYPPICPDKEESVMKCYQDNPKQSLVCSSIVKDFSECVAAASLTALSQAG